jgi:hypothetical protein
VITIQSAMLVALGFLAANLLALLIAPAFWARAVRLTTRRLKQAMPLTEAEIRADKDKLRAEFAIRLHQLQSEVEQARLAAARQLVEINRRDARINALEAEVEQLKADLEEAHNRLSDARRLIITRDREIAELARTADKQSRALSEAASINAQQQSEIERLSSSLTTRAARNRDGLSDPRFDAEVALRSELEALRAKTRDQAEVIDRLQREMAQDAGSDAMQINGASVSGDDRRRIAPGEPASGDQPLQAKAQDQDAEIARLRAALAVFEGEGDDDKPSIRDSKIALKAQLGAAQAQTEEQRKLIDRLRSELAAANEQLARQTAHFANELKRLGTGTLPASAQPRRELAEPRLTLAERVAQARLSPPAVPGEAAGGPNGAASNGAGPKVATSGTHSGENAAPSKAGAPATARETGGPQPEGDADAEAGSTPPERRSSLLERISSLAKTS